MMVRKWERMADALKYCLVPDVRMRSSVNSRGVEGRHWLLQGPGNLTGLPNLLNFLGKLQKEGGD